MACYLLVIGEREALAWVLRTRRMAFPPLRRREVNDLRQGDRLLLLTTRGCFHNPTRDRTRVVGEAVVTSPVTPVDPPLELVGRTFDRGCDLELFSLAPYLSGVELVPMIPKLESFPDTRAWAIKLRRPLVSLTEHDGEVIRKALRPMTREPDELVNDYLQRIRPVRPLTRNR